MAEHNKTFYLKGGKTVSSLKALARELKSMSQDIYVHHVNPDKNDFAVWIRHSMSNDQLAKKVEGHINKIEFELEVLRHLLFEMESNKKKSTKKRTVAKKAPAKASAKKKALAPPKPAATKSSTSSKKSVKKSTAKKPASKRTATSKKSKK